MTRPREAVIAAAIAIVAIFIGAAKSASASPSIWTLARDPAERAREEVRTQAEVLTLQYRHVLRTKADTTAATLADRYLERARALLEEAGADASPDPRLRFQLAEVDHLLHDDGAAVKLLESVVRSEAPAPIRADAWSQLAEAYTRLGRYEDEIRSYDSALALEPHAFSRSRLLANRAESFMLLGDTTAAIAGYRASLSLLGTPVEMFTLGPTTLWGLGVALDRSGDLDGGIDAIRLARTYDAVDKNINGPGWFYVPAYDRYWYQALGRWSAARNAENKAARAEHYLRATALWEEYIDRAAPDDRWLPIARARSKQCEKEREAVAAREAGEPRALPRLPSLRRTRPAPK